jgi:hypothetical protein
VVSVSGFLPLGTGNIATFSSSDEFVVRWLNEQENFWWPRKIEEIQVMGEGRVFVLLTGDSFESKLRCYIFEPERGWRRNGVQF